MSNNKNNYNDTKKRKALAACPTTTTTCCYYHNLPFLFGNTPTNTPKKERKHHLLPAHFFVIGAPYTHTYPGFLSTILHHFMGRKLMQHQCAHCSVVVARCSPTLWALMGFQRRS
mmetsp:Transcript_41514/g.66751  ORF Transcript_41514/g.66751 Transcript_41514/m.66751 type:complete len:115 (+) Transcript_41514:85-429(+)